MIAVPAATSQVGTKLEAETARVAHEQPLVRGRQVEIDSQGGKRARPKRTALTEISIGKVVLLPPKGPAGKAAR